MKRNKQLILLTGLLLSGFRAFGQAAATGGDPNFYNDLLSRYLIGFVIVAVLGSMAVLIYLLNTMVKIQQLKIYQENGLDAYLEEVQKPHESLWAKLYKWMTKATPVEKEKDILFDHAYDGIRELDNSLPPWWVAMFYITILFAAVYMGYYHFGGKGPSSTEMYEAEMKTAEEEVKALLASQANLVDETNVEMTDDSESLALGGTIFQTKCAVCHGQLGEGGVGPNMTDNYWIHGGSIKDVFKTIKYGVPEKGMIPWNTELRPADMQKVASYIMTLRGTNPPNAKSPQGELYELESQPVDSVAIDSVQAGQKLSLLN